MTTIVLKNGFLYSDSRVTRTDNLGNITYSTTDRKIFKTLNGYYGITGFSHFTENKIHYIDGHRRTMLYGTNDVMRIVNNRVYIYTFNTFEWLDRLELPFSNSKLHTNLSVSNFIDTDNYLTMGSGSEYMAEALDAGMNIEDAFLYTSINDDYTDTNIHRMEIKNGIFRNL